MLTVPTRLEGPVLLEPPVHRDARGFMVETFRADRLAAAGIEEEFVQDNHSRSGAGTIRGMHFQLGTGQAKLVRCVRGAILDVVVDLRRRSSPTFGRWESFVLDDERARSLYVPVGFAHGFAALAPEVDVLYKCSSYYDPAAERVFAHDDPAVGIEWPAGERVLSERDRSAPPLAAVTAELPW